MASFEPTKDPNDAWTEGYEAGYEGRQDYVDRLRRALAIATAYIEGKPCASTNTKLGLPCKDNGVRGCARCEALADIKKEVGT